MATKIQGIEGLTPGELRHQNDIGGRFVYYKYTISAFVVTFWRSSDVYFVKANESRVVKGLGWTGLTLLLGWWGIPWGPIRSVVSLWTNLRGGEDVTDKVIGSLGLGGSGVAPFPTPRTPPENFGGPPSPPPTR